ncbi:hypothetical protein PCANB_000797 [Pneumocystis canis]|nr:hypothetical protein PCANB_000797 [Pneumocystis canis]
MNYKSIKGGVEVFEWIGNGTILTDGRISYEMVSWKGELYKKGDCVLVHNDNGKGLWAAMIMCFYETLSGEKMANLLWFERSDHIRREKRQFPTSHNELLICGIMDPNELSVFQRKIQVLSYETFTQIYPQGLTKKMKDYDKVFYCRRGFHSRKEIYLDFIDWDQFYRQEQTDFEKLITWIEEAERKEDELLAIQQEEHELSNEEDSDIEKIKMEDIYVPVHSESESSNIMSLETNESSSNDSFTYKTPKKRKKNINKMITPLSERRKVHKKPLETTPLPLRYLSCDESVFSPYQSARSRLHVSTVPSTLPCREKEFSLIYSQVLNALETGHGECIYVSGTPGTGKTVTIKEVVRSLFQKVEEGDIDDFKYLEINGMRIIDPNQTYTLLWEALTEESVTSKHALMLLERRFSQPNPNRVPCVVLIDELDQLVTKDQKVMYNMFNWPTLQHSRLIVIAVANTMDLPERMLTNKISSRLGLTRICFPGYTFDQLQTIIRTRLQGIHVLLMDQDAIELVSRKVSAVSGDARRALDICRRAVEIAQSSVKVLEGSTPKKENELSQLGKVTIRTINAAIAEMSSSPVQMYLRTMPLAYKVFLVSLMLKMKQSGIAEHTLNEIMDIAAHMCKSSENPKLQALFHQTFVNIDLGLINAAFALAEVGILFLNIKNGKRNALIQLKITQQDVKMAFQNDIDFKESI